MAGKPYPPAAAGQAQHYPQNQYPQQYPPEYPQYSQQYPQQYPPPPYPAQSYPAQSYPAQPYPAQPVYMDTTTTMMVLSYQLDPNRSEVPVKIRCPHCNQEGITVIEKKVGAGTWIVCTGLLVFGFFPFNYLPFCLDQCKDTEHRCGSCRVVLGNKTLI